MSNPLIKCCPTPPGYTQPLTYIWPNGQFLDPTTGNVLMVTSWTGGQVSILYDRCVVLSGTNGVSNAFEPVPCGCCPGGLTYVSPDGRFFNSIANVVSQLMNGPTHSASTYYGKCALIENGVTPYGEPTNPLTDCPCCPNGYTYDSTSNLCLQNSGADKGVLSTQPIPCITCTCVEPAPVVPPECVECQQSAGLPITFKYNPFMKNCTDCVKQDFILAHDPKLNMFMPYFLILPDKSNNFNLED